MLIMPLPVLHYSPLDCVPARSDMLHETPCLCGELHRPFRDVRLHLAGRENKPWAGRSVLELFPQKNAKYELCPYCEGVAGEGDDPDPWLPGYFLASNSIFADPAGRRAPGETTSPKRQR